MKRSLLLLLIACAFTACDSKPGYNREDLQNRPTPPAAKFTATIVLVDKLPLARAQVIVVRRRTDKPADMIVLSNEHATPGALGAGIQALVNARKVVGEITPRDTSIIVTAEAIPKAWEETGLREEALKEIEDLKRQPVDSIPGFGRARSRVINLAPAK